MSGLLIAVLLLLDAGCGTERPEGDGGPEQSANSSGDSGGATRKYETIKGVIEIPAQPERIVATQYLGHLLTLGVKPVGAGGASMKQYFLKDRIEGIVDIGDDASALEAIASLEPDLIIRPSDKNYEQFSKIAPTIVIPWGQKDVYEELRDFGDLLGKSKEAEAAIAHFESKVAEAKKKLEGVVAPGETVGVYEIWAKSFWAVSESFGRGTRNLYTSLGYRPPDSLKDIVRKRGSSGLDMSLETLPQYAADHMFVSVYAADGGDKRAEDIMNSELWKSLPAVKNGRVYRLNIDQFAAGDLISLEKQLELQTEMLLSGASKRK
ncbi:ABC transporter substrate-binding protein [Paenibacillus flagellatus]|uniref:ABC transporter substrate-binding protein n=2 Tax=Paenibacillus flagellatus TaxID=2211139 RepID=A0A2V5KGI7_9BACL|nr:ABC transporter substrate-binding protein [Paenibacillus flagellatus]